MIAIEISRHRSMIMRALTLLLVLATAGCSSQIWTVEKELSRREVDRQVADTMVRVDPLLAGGRDRRFAITLERAWKVSGEREYEVIRMERPFNPFYEAVEMVVGILVAPFYVILFPVIFPISEGLDADRASVIGYFAIVGERFLNPTRNDLIQEPVSEKVVQIRREPFEDREYEEVPPEERNLMAIELLGVLAIPGDRPDAPMPVPGARLEGGDVLVLPPLPEQVEEYLLRLRIDGQDREIPFQDY